MSKTNEQSLGLILIILGTIALYIYSATFPFLPLDDTDIIQSKLPYLGDITNLWDIFTTPLYKDLVTSLYRPLLYMTFMIDTILGNQSPSTFHISNILFHLIAILLVFRLFLYFTATQKTALLLTAIFALHPIHVHAVAWISGRNDILLAINLLLIIIAYLTALNSSKQRYLYLHFFFLFSSFFVKETAIVIPILLVIHATLVNRDRQKLKMLSIGWVISSGFAILLRSFVVTTDYPLKFTGLLDSIQNFGIAFINYFGKLFIPYNYSVLPDIADMTILPGIVALTIFIIVTMVIKKRNRKLFWFGIVWYILFMTPTIVWSIFSRIGEYYEHRSYIPLIGILISISQLKWGKISLVSSRAKLITLSCLVFLLLISSVDRLIRYRSPLSFVDSAVAESPSLARSHSMRGHEYQNIGDYDTAEKEYTSALEINPYIPWVYSNYGQIKLNLGQTSESIELFTIAIKMNPKDGNAHFNRAIAYVIIKQLPLALDDFDNAINLEPENADYYYNRGLALESICETEKALVDFEQANVMLPEDELLREKIFQIKSGRPIDE